MRADRLITALLLLQGRERITAAELAEELEVSVATARRDLEALSSAGIPVYPQPGRHGGWTLLGGARTDLSGLTAPEAQALFLLVGPAAAVSDEAKTALRKLVRALPSTFRESAEAAAGATVIDATRWGERTRTEPDAVARLRGAVVDRRRVRLDYANAHGERRAWTVDPLGLVDKDEVWYLLAETERRRRTFRAERMVDVAVMEDRFERPAGFDLDAAWAEVVGEVERRRSTTRAVVVIESRWVRILRDQFGRHCEVEAELPDGRSRVAVAAPTALDIARHLAGWGAAVEVLDPPEVRAELARIGAELAGVYEGDPVSASR